MKAEAELIALRAEVASLKKQVAQLLVANAQLQAQLDKFRSNPPSFVKPSTPKPKDKDKVDKTPRRKRAKEQNAARQRDTPTQTVEHRIVQCPDCSYPLRHPTLAKRRQVIELPPPQPVEVTEHQLFRSWCARCSKWHYAHVDLSGQVIGHGRMGVRIASLIAYLSTCMRMPVRLIKEYLYTVHSLSISAGEIVGLLHRTAEAKSLRGAALSIRERVRGSRVVHADETTWREEGQNGYIWSFSTPEGERLYEYRRSRAGEIPRGILGTQFKGVLCSDFYCGYNGYSGEHQRCWTHLLRDLHTLKEGYPANGNQANQANPINTVNEEVQEWAKGVRSVYDDANELLLAHELGPPTDEEVTQHPLRYQERQRAYERLVGEIAKLGHKYATAKEYRTHPCHAMPCHALCKRLLRHQDELFQFVLVPGLSSSNNLAERSVRPLVISRKVSGGTQSERGSTTRMTLASLLGTWRAKGLNPFDHCLALLSL